MTVFSPRTEFLVEELQTIYELQRSEAESIVADPQFRDLARALIRHHHVVSTSLECLQRSVERCFHGRAERVPVEQ